MIDSTYLRLLMTLGTYFPWHNEYQERLVESLAPNSSIASSAHKPEEGNQEGTPFYSLIQEVGKHQLVRLLGKVTFRRLLFPTTEFQMPTHLTLL